jgi:hypothetical protein
MTGSSFGFVQQEYTTNFGLYAYGPFGIHRSTSRSMIPEMVFSIETRRSLLEILVTDLLPVIVIALILFIILMTDAGQGFGGLIPSISGAFFATVIAHMQFRTKIPSYTIAYFELFFYALYIMILLVAMVTIMHLFKVPIWFIRYRDNLLSNILYWPLFMSMLFIMTLIYLY